MRDYFNTNRETGETLQRSRNNAQTQQEQILDFYIQNDHPFSPDEIRENVFNNSCPLTSVRRAITNLTDAGELEKTGIMQIGTFGKQVNTWKLKRRRWF
jgi:Fe2+ or Zn2+ uptake regulation protein